MTKYLLLTSMFLGSLAYTSTQAQPWAPASENTLREQGLEAKALPSHYHLAQADTVALLSQLQTAPAESFGVHPSTITHQLLLPFPDGSVHAFRIVNSPVMEEGLQAKYPEIRMLKGYEVNDSGSMRLTWDPYTGLHVFIRRTEGDIQIDPYLVGNKGYYISYYQRDAYRASDRAVEEATPQEGVVQEGTLRQIISQGPSPSQDPSIPVPPSTGEEIRVLRLALSCTGNAAHRLARTPSPTVAGVLAGMVRYVSDANVIFEHELSVRLLLAEGNDRVIYLDPDTDPFDEADPHWYRLSAENHRNTLGVLGADSFDIGHLLYIPQGKVKYIYAGVDDSGFSVTGSVCDPDHKAEGMTDMSTVYYAEGDPLPNSFFDFFLHQLGHQFGATHSFNFHTAYYSRGYYSYEPGLGTTIMKNLTSRFDHMLEPVGYSYYFHAISRYEILSLLKRVACGWRSLITNRPPIIVKGPRPGLVIPVMTPFELTARTVDPEGDEPFIYRWEQMDRAPYEEPWYLPSDTGPLFRSRQHTYFGGWYTRTFPSMQAIIAGFPGRPSIESGLRGEVLPTKTREMNFVFTALDKYGASSSMLYKIRSNWESGPFLVTSPNGGEVLTGGEDVIVTWDPANTGIGSPVNCNDVNIFLLYDYGGGVISEKWSLGLYPNTGRAIVKLPVVTSSEKKYRIKIKAFDNVFFDISNEAFTIVPASPGSRLLAEGEEAVSKKGFILAPNPVGDWLQLQGNAHADQGPVFLEVVDLLGRTVLRHTWQQAVRQAVDVSRLSAGIYTARITSNGQTSQHKLVKATP